MKANQPGASKVEGASATLLRFPDHISATIKLTQAPMGSVMTAWFYVFNNPENCSDKDSSTACAGDESKCSSRHCGDADLTNPAVDASIVYAGPGIVDASGNVEFAGALFVGDKSSVETGDGLKDAAKADVHLTVRNHGLPVTGATLVDQMGTFNGGCTGECKIFGLSVHESDSVQVYVGVEDEDHNVAFWDFNKDGKNDTLAGQAGFTNIQGAYATLLRQDNAIDVVMHLPPGTAMPNHIFTIWAAPFNNPDKCKAGCMAAVCVNGQPACGPMDVENPEVNASRVKLAGGMVRPDGSIHLAGHLDVGDIRNAQFGNGLVLPMTAHIHVVMRGHGPLATNSATTAISQLSSFNGGCMGACPNVYTSHHE